LFTSAISQFGIFAAAAAARPPTARIRPLRRQAHSYPLFAARKPNSSVLPASERTSEGMNKFITSAWHRSAARV